MKTVRGQEEMQAAADEVLESVVPGSRANVVSLSGDLGAGKTAFAQAVARTLGVKESVTSPTFIIERVYRLSEERGRGFQRLIHIDAYRLQDESELKALGWEEMVSNPHNLILIEWGERVASLLPKDAIRLRLSFVDDTTRTITYEH